MLSIPEPSFKEIAPVEPEFIEPLQLEGEANNIFKRDDIINEHNAKY